MNNAFFFNSYNFFTHIFEKYHYTDNRSGSPQHYLAYMESGNCKIVSDKLKIEIVPGDIFYIPKGLSYQSYWHSRDDIRFKSLGFDFFPESNNHNFILQLIDCDAEAKEKIRHIPTNISVTSTMLGDFYSVLTSILPKMRYDNFSRRKNILEKAKLYIYENTDCRISDIAKYCLVSESALYELFKKEMGTSPNEFRQRTLCEKAVILLTTTDKSVQEISDTLGFSSPSYFRKQLHKHIGKTPREIRKTTQYL